jgi:hypothetical protein
MLCDCVILVRILSRMMQVRMYDLCNYPKMMNVAERATDTDNLESWVNVGGRVRP